MMGANEKVKKEKMANIVRELKKDSLDIQWKKSGDISKDIVLSVLVEKEESMDKPLF